MMEKDTVARLKNDGEYTVFSYAGKRIVFLTSKNLDRYTEIKKWDHGYLEVMAKNYGKDVHEDYIDLVPILENLYMNPDSFLDEITEVRLDYAE